MAIFSTSQVFHALLCPQGMGVIPDLSRVIDFYLAHPADHPNYAAASDIVRLICLARWGGLYLDVDNGFHGPCPSSPVSEFTKA